jgi:hypothetical protein
MMIMMMMMMITTPQDRMNLEFVNLRILVLYYPFFSAHGTYLLAFNPFSRIRLKEGLRARRNTTLSALGFLLLTGF